MMTAHRFAHAGEQRRQAGFTLVELMIVVAVIAILASIAVPNFLSTRGRANEAAVISTLRNIHTSQGVFSARVALDMNGNGLGEYGFLGELSGITPLRSDGLKIAPPVLQPAFGQLDPDGAALRSGYHFRLYLPDASGVGQPETTAAMAQVSSELAEHYYSVVAWPLLYGRTGQRSFFMNQRGEILGCIDKTYSGKSRIPVANAAMPASLASGFIATNSMASLGTVALDGNRWSLVN